MGFDITSILEFRPPNHVCPACRGLFNKINTDYRPDPMIHRCPLCEVQFIVDDYPETDDFADDFTLAIDDYFSRGGWTIDHGDLLAHATVLAEIIERSKGEGVRRQPWRTMRTFFEVISRARYFVHFSTWGISHVMIGALKMASMRVPVYGFASNVEAGARAQLTEYPDEAPQLTAHVIPSTEGVYDAPHQKILIIDGLVAFKGSTNLTTSGVRRADRGLDISEVVTDFAQVTELNNKYFAPVWRRIAAPKDDKVVVWRHPFC
ncbi:hypothetical protein [Mycobacterium gastri]|uniref:PLD phosphodiesterase domain-containing protein n=1 Tax=Mycobacterium gastri TaxID=1777 RepID=A0A1X1V8I0_MYCGS|nr:hypothetical protein [Mycobacterium gastri]ETW22187.1 hypothetical protein MGAST_21485 [Mycobacterium gastri 'Wayne']ORV65352.1 hypothetical protein AWC07_13465 [Mycobacterium gastri]